MALPGAARAGEAEAAAFFSAAQAAYSKKDYTAAAVAFQAAYREAAHPAASYNAGVAWELAGKPEQAADALAIAVLGAKRLGKAEAQDARRRLQKLEKTLGILEVTGPASLEVTVGHAVRAHPPARIHLSAGKHEVKVQNGTGWSRAYTVDARPGATLILAVEAPADPPASPPVETPPADPSSTAETGPAAPSSEGASSRMLPVLGGISLGLGAGAAAAAIGTGVEALAARDTFLASQNTDAAAHDKARDLRTATNVLWAVAGVTAAAGATLLIVHAATGPKNVSIRLGPAAGSIVVRF